MKRRGFLGMSLGAAVAGPGMAKEALHQMPTGLGSAVKYVGYSGAEATKTGDVSPEWNAQQIIHLRRLLAGEKTAEEQEREAMDRRENRRNIISHEIACLKSVSGTAKLDMYERKIREISDDRQRYWWQRELDDLLKGKG